MGSYPKKGLKTVGYLRKLGRLNIFDSSKSPRWLPAETLMMKKARNHVARNCDPCSMEQATGSGESSLSEILLDAGFARFLNCR